MSKQAFISLENAEHAMSFSLAPSLLGELKKEEKKQEQFQYTPCFDSKGAFMGLVVEKAIIFIG